MQFNKTQEYSKISAITIILILSIAALIVSIPSTNAQEDLTFTTYNYLTALPSTVGVGQSLYISGWLDLTPPYTITWGGEVWSGFTVEITKPDGQKETKGPFDTDPISGYFFLYTPSQVGEYQFKATFPEQMRPVPDNDKPTGQWLQVVGNHTFLSSVSETMTVTVQEDPTPTWQAEPLPTGFWTRPISAVHRDWNTISGNWLGGGEPKEDYNAYSTSPGSAHIVWTKPYQEGGLIGGEYGSGAYHGGCAYEGKWYDPIVINGILYIQEYGHGGSQYYPDFVAVDLRTGEEVWRVNGTGRGDTVTQRLSGGGARFGMWDGYPKMDFGQVLYFSSYNQHGAFAYLWTSGGRGGTGRVDLIDAFTGDYVLTLENIPGGTTVRGPSGEILKYGLSTSNDVVKVWNSTAAIGMAGPTGTDSAQWRPWVGATMDVSGPYLWNVSEGVNVDEPYEIISEDYIVDLTGRAYNITNTRQNERNGLIYSWWVDPFTQEFSIPTDISGGIDAIEYGNMMVGGSGPSGTYYTNAWQMWALSLEPGREGQLLWKTDFPAPPGNKTWRQGPMSIADGVMTFFEKETQQWYGYSTLNGNKLWGPTESTIAYDMFEIRPHIADGKLFSVGYGGLANCYDLQTGELLWSFRSADPTNEAFYGGSYPLVCGPIADGKVILLVREHSPVDPKPRGAQLYCLDVETGEELWTITHWSNVQHAPFGLIADGYLVDADAYDMRIYCFGKGQTETTVSIQNNIVANGDSVLIQGTVTDQSPGASGTPAIADEDMTAWMEYLYKQFAMPKDAKGVSIKLSTIDPNGNTVDVGTVTSDIEGMFKTMWTPEHPGEYTVIATFEGSESYFSSTGRAAVGVTEAPEVTPPPEDTPAPMTDTYVLGTGIAIIAAIAVAVFLILRKK